VQHQLAVTGFSYAVVAALIGGNKLETFEVERNPDFIEELEAKAEDFWGKVQRKEAPPADGSEATSKVLKRLHPDDDGSTIVLDEEAEELTAQLEAAKVEKSFAEAREKEAKNKLQAKIGAATFGQLPGGRILSLKTTSRAGHYVDESKYRTLRIEKTKKGSK
jgi:predicted phage-related endonuclease